MIENLQGKIAFDRLLYLASVNGETSCCACCATERANLWVYWPLGNIHSSQGVEKMHGRVRFIGIIRICTKIRRRRIPINILNHGLAMDDSVFLAFYRVEPMDCTPSAGLERAFRLELEPTNRSVL